MILSPQEAAIMLGVETDTIAVWELRFGYPERRNVGPDQWGYAHEDLISLRIGLDTTFSVAAAVARARAPESSKLWQQYG
jgi:hypothetical protein